MKHLNLIFLWSSYTTLFQCKEFTKMPKAYKSSMMHHIKYFFH
jgi:hypothetical protein